MISRHFSSRQTILLFSFLVLSTLLAPSSIAANNDRSPGGLLYPGTQLDRSDSGGIHFQLHSGPFQIDQDGHITVEGLEQVIQEPGSPAVPYYSTFIALPPKASVSVSVTESGISEYQKVEIAPAPQHRLWAEPDPDGILAADPQTVTEPAPSFVKDTAVYNLDAPFPEAGYEVSEPLYLRDLRMVELKLFPLRYNPMRKSLTQAAEMSVQITFTGAVWDNLNLASGFVDTQGEAWHDSILNFDQARGWRSLPQAAESEPQGSDLPIGINTFKILVDKDGIYEISADELAAQGMALPVDPGTIQMMHGGQPVAFQFINAAGDGQFDLGDKIRFYGWAFDGSRYEQMYVNDNVFWLWAGGSAATIPIRANEAGSGTVVTTFVDSVTKHDENDNFSGWAVQWENEPALWHTDLINIASGTTQSKTYDMELHDPDPTAAGNSVLVEFTTRLSGLTSILPTYSAKTFLNDYAEAGQANWIGHKNVNVKNFIPGNELKQPIDSGYPDNQVRVELLSDSATQASVYLTRITIEYTRFLKSVGDQLIFSSNLAGRHDYHVNGFSSGDAASALVWDITDRRQPEQIRIEAQNIQGSGSDYTFVIGRTHAQGAQFIATTTSNIQAVKNISRYMPISLDPPSGKAQWLAITHSSLRDAADTLATYRKAEFSTWVVNIEDVVNQVGYGFNTPQAIRNYLIYALGNWTTSPEYVTLFGDATRNPLNQDCPLCNYWDKDAPTLLVTDFAFVDRWNGMIPTDYTMSLIIGNDLIPDLAIGRMPANTLSEANHMVQKVISYESQREDELEQWQRNFLFVADNADSGGNFCYENELTGNIIPKLSYSQTHLCLPSSSAVDTDALRLEMGRQINDIGTSVLNYRGHGSPSAWAQSPGSSALLTIDDTDFWQNVGRSVVILSADCLDGYFINTHLSSLGETFHRLNNRGSAAHWSSSGLGFSSEHSVLHSKYYEGVFKYRFKEIGKAVNYSKVQYYQAGQYPSELYSFVLLGDPALKVLPKVEIGSGKILLPVILTQGSMS